MAFVRDLVHSGQLHAARDVGDGGLAGCLIKMSYESGLAVTATLAEVSANDAPLEDVWFAELGGCYVLLFKDEAAAQRGLTRASALNHCTLTQIGHVAATGVSLTIDGHSLDPKTLITASRRYLSFA